MDANRFGWGGGAISHVAPAVRLNAGVEYTLHNAIVFRDEFGRLRMVRKVEEQTPLEHENGNPIATQESR